MLEKCGNTFCLHTLQIIIITILNNEYSIIQNKWHRGRRGLSKVSFTFYQKIY
jgi:hypothetical protein